MRAEGTKVNGKSHCLQRSIVLKDFLFLPVAARTVVLSLVCALESPREL